MAMPSSPEARRFYRCSLQRYREAEILIEAGQTTGAVYLAGYGIECILKALILSAVTLGVRSDTLKSFRGNRAHEYDWLRGVYLMNGGSRLPREIIRQFFLVSGWTTDLRYRPGTIPLYEADEFMAAALAIIDWAQGKL